MPEIFVVDAFTDTPFRGNPAGVVLLTEIASDAWMQSVAKEMRHSETAFVDVRPGLGEPRSLRWFTPETEVDLCGHATLATTHVLGGEQRFMTKSGELKCRVARGGWIEMDFPLDTPTPETGTAILADSLGDLPVEQVLRGRSDALVVVPDELSVRNFVPNLERIAAIDASGIILTAAASDTDFVARFFAPRVGVAEDPVTGSAHCTLAAYWGQRLNKNELISRQVSQRSGTVRMTLMGDRVALKGQAVTMLRGVFQ